MEEAKLDWRRKAKRTLTASVLLPRRAKRALCECFADYPALLDSEVDFIVSQPLFSELRGR